jgi:outer membrane protein insertion porin family
VLLLAVAAVPWMAGCRGFVPEADLLPPAIDLGHSASRRAVPAELAMEGSHGVDGAEDVVVRGQTPGATTGADSQYGGRPVNSISPLESRSQPAARGAGSTPAAAPYPTTAYPAQYPAAPAATHAPAAGSHVPYRGTSPTDNGNRTALGGTAPSYATSGSYPAPAQYQPPSGGSHPSAGTQRYTPNASYVAGPAAAANYPMTGMTPIWQAGPDVPGPMLPGTMLRPDGTVGVPMFPPGLADPTIDPYRFLDLDVHVQEARTGRIMIGAGINSDAGLLGNFMIEEQNFDWRRWPTSWEDVRAGTAFRGAGQRFRLEAMPGTQVQRYLVSFQEPYLWNTPISLGLSGFFYDRRFFDWDEQRLGGHLSLGYEFPNDWTIVGRLRGEEVTIHRPRIVPPVPEVAEVLGSNNLYSYRFALAHDTRDSAFLPTQGHLIEVAYEHVFGTFQYPIGTAEARQYFTLRERIDGSGRHVLSVAGQLGVAGDETPVYDHFFAGGFTTMRGFQYRGASPRTGGVIVGGEFQVLGSVEYMFPITADDMLRGVTFVDFGTVERDVRIDSDNFRIAPGFGLRISHPGLGPAPIALDLAFPVANATGDQIRNFSFFIGVRR